MNSYIYTVFKSSQQIQIQIAQRNYLFSQFSCEKRYMLCTIQSHHQVWCTPLWDKSL